MGKCYCDYCDVFLTNDSVAVRKQHNDGNRHKYNVCEYYKQYIGQQLQEQIDAIVESFELRVAQGLIIPSYGLPPVQKTAAKDATGQDDKQQKCQDDKDGEGKGEDGSAEEERDTSAKDTEGGGTGETDRQSTAQTASEAPGKDDNGDEQKASPSPPQVDTANEVDT